MVVKQEKSIGGRKKVGDYSMMTRELQDVAVTVLDNKRGFHYLVILCIPLYEE
jgi:hypothetical protein